MVVRSRMFKLSSGKSLGRRIRLFSSSPSQSPSPSPYLLIPGDVVEECKAVNFKSYDPRKGETVELPEQELPPELCPAERVGASHGWLALLNKRDLSLHLTNIFNPCVSASASKVISLPPLDSLPCFLSFTRNQDASASNLMPGTSLNYKIPDGSHIDELVDHVSLSSSPEQDDCIVGVSFWDRAFTLCRLGDSKWTYNEDRLGQSASSHTYSKRGRLFYRIRHLHYLVEVHDLNNPEFVPRRYTYSRPNFLNVPDSLDSEAAKLGLLYGKEYIVETPTGELLVATREYRKSEKGREILGDNFKGDDFKSHDAPKETMRILVYKLDVKRGTRTYTEDMGDLSLFLGRNEAFCLSACPYLGLKPNSIYFTDDQYTSDAYGGFEMGVYDLSEKSVIGICNSVECKVVPASFWLSPPPPPAASF